MDRRYDIDWIRVIVLGLLIVYHAWCSFMPFAKEIYMPQNKDFLMTIGIPMSLINIWRIPLLFMISGMGMFFAMQRRSWKEIDKRQEHAYRCSYGFWFIVHWTPCIISEYVVLQRRDSVVPTFNPSLVSLKCISLFLSTLTHHNDTKK